MPTEIKTEYTLIFPGGGQGNARLERILQQAAVRQKQPGCILEKAESLEALQNRRLLFAISLNEWGMNLEWMRMLEKIRRDSGLLEGCAGAVIVDAPSELYTKAAGREAVLAANMSGCLFPGRPLVEGTASLYNFHTQAALAGCSLEEAYVRAAEDLVGRLLSLPGTGSEGISTCLTGENISEGAENRCLTEDAGCSALPKLLVLHASIRETSNTFRLWNMVREKLEGSVESREISLQNGAVHDCVGCPFTACMHFARQKSCFYGGVVVDQVYPALEESRGVMFLCPNYNDALSANISASINRLTALYRVHPFFDKLLYGIVVSGYSGGELVASQLVSSMNMNKAFLLPPRFAMLETANDPGSILKVPGIGDRAAAFAEQIIHQMNG